jgi:hypothetical protein
MSLQRDLKLTELPAADQFLCQDSLTQVLAEPSVTLESTADSSALTVSVRPRAVTNGLRVTPPIADIQLYVT